MFKRFKRYFYSLTLTRQFLLIILLLSTLFLCVVVPYITNSVKLIAEQQIYNELSNQQSQMVSLFETSDNNLLPEYKDKATMRVNHLIYDVSTDMYQSLSEIKKEDLVAYQYYAFRPAVHQMIDEGKDHAFYKSAIDGDVLYLALSKSTINDQWYWISFGYSEISNHLLDQLQSRLVVVFYVIIFAFTLIICLWIYTLIKPLKEIRHAIDEIKDNHPASLTLYRKDEIGQVGEALIDMNDSLIKQKQLQTDLIHNISHDLKTPIAIIKNYTECMKDGIYPYGNQNSSLEVVYSNADRLEHKVKDFLYLNRLDYLKEQETPQTYLDVAEVMKDVVDDLKILNDSIRIETSFEKLLLKGEREHWYSCLMNIMDNALHYATSVIKIDSHNGKLSIYNDGEPIDLNVIDHIFEPYTKGAKGNFGLGMSIVYKICTMYDCDIHVENIDQGVRFCIKSKESV